MTQAVEGNSIPDCFDEAVYPGNSRQFVKGFDLRQQTTGLRRLSGRWRLNLFRFVCTPKKRSAVLPPATRALLPH